MLLFSPFLAFVIEKKITLTSDASSRPPVTIKFHNLHAGNIKGVGWNNFLPWEGLVFLFFLFL
jgi:hypothetical protein